MKILETERLTLHQMTREDAPFLLELMNEPEFVRSSDTSPGDVGRSAIAAVHLSTSHRRDRDHHR